MLDPTAATERTYDQIAHDYHARWHDLDPLLADRERFCDLLPSGGPILDVGCGTGRDMTWFRGHGRNVVGIDRSLEMLALAREAISQTGLLVRTDVRRLPFRKRFAGWWASASLLHLPRPHLPAALAGLRAVTEKNGVGYLSVKVGDGDGWDGPPGASRYFCYWRAEQLDQVVRESGWATIDSWASEDSLGRRPWLVRLLRAA